MFVCDLNIPEAVEVLSNAQTQGPAYEWQSTHLPPINTYSLLYSAARALVHRLADTK